MGTEESFEALLRQRGSCRDYAAQAVALEAVLCTLDAGQGLRTDDAKRTAPSAHALYPLTLFVIARHVSALSAGVYEYAPSTRQLQHTGIEIEAGKLLSVSLAEDRWLEEAPAIIVIAADLRLALDSFRDQQADGMRGRRYVDFEAGAVAQNMALSVASRGLGGVVVMGIDEQLLKRQLGLRAGLEPVALYCLGVPAETVVDGRT